MVMAKFATKLIIVSWLTELLLEKYTYNTNYKLELFAQNLITKNT